MLDAEIARNFDYFQRTLAHHLRDHAGEYALLKDGQVRDYFVTIGEADHAGWTRYADRLYSVQQVTSEPVELGVYANAVG